ncbi:MAG TPA: LysM domain-containing protein [Dehalococcoidia bacterium]|nr:LysM domain-containing protein [Dehalococcoidia bacterium]
MRRALLFLTVLVAGFALSGCLLGGDDDDDPPDEGEEAAIPGEEDLAIEDVPEAPAPQSRAEPIVIAADQVPGAPSGSGGGEGNYTVVAGDTCGGIAEAHGITTDALVAANSGLDCGALQVGQSLVVPAAEEPEDGEEGEETADDDDADDTEGGDGTYTVQSGDTGAAIAEACGITLDELADLNPDADLNALQVGQELNVPPGCSP